MKPSVLDRKGIDSYANPVAVLSAAIVTGADAIHPGYGFYLSVVILRRYAKNEDQIYWTPP